MTLNRLVGVFFLVFGALSYFILIPQGIVVPSNIQHFTTSPAFWPNIITVIIAIMGLLLVLQNSDVEDINTEDIEEELEDHTSWKTRAPRLLIILSMLFAFYFSIEKFGMVAPAMLLILILMLFAGYRRWSLILLFSILVPTALYFFFTHVANIPIPLGIFETLRG
ncbi:MAG: putative tricarboxylic transport membrane protein [Cocleimonas sp.]|jgi:putative tricarboxylic transport membrane protein